MDHSCEPRRRAVLLVSGLRRGQALRAGADRSRAAVGLWLLFGLLAASPLFPASSSPQKPADSAPPVVIDIRPVLNQQKLREGANTVYVKGGGDISLVARVQGGNIIGYSVTGRSGKNVPIILTKDLTPASIRREIEKLSAQDTPVERRKRKMQQLHDALERMLEELEGGEEKGCWIMGVIMQPSNPDGAMFFAFYTDCPKGAR